MQYSKGKAYVHETLRGVRVWVGFVFYETGIGADAAPIRQSMTQVTAADSMREEFVPTFWYVSSACLSIFAQC